MNSVDEASPAFPRCSNADIRGKGGGDELAPEGDWRRLVCCVVRSRLGKEVYDAKKLNRFDLPINIVISFVEESRPWTPCNSKKRQRHRI